MPLTGTAAFGATTCLTAAGAGGGDGGGGAGAGPGMGAGAEQFGVHNIMAGVGALGLDSIVMLDRR